MKCMCEQAVTQAAFENAEVLDRFENHGKQRQAAWKRG